MIEIYAILLVILSTAISSFGSIQLKKCSKKFNLNIFQQIKNIELIIGVFLFIIGFIIYYLAIQKSNLSVIYSMTSLSYVWIALFSSKFLNEKIDNNKKAGILLIIIGVSLVTYFS